MPTTQAAPSLVQSFRDSNGNPLAGGQLYTYVAGTSTPQSTYIDATGTTANANPVVLNSRGEAPVWLTIGQSYKFVLYDAFSTLIYSVDQIAATNPIGTPIALSATGITGAAASGANADITSLTGPVSTVNGQTLQHTNDIINGNFVIAQAGTSFGAQANGAYDLDGWTNQNSSAAIFGVSQTPAGTAGRMQRLVTITTADTSFTTSKYVADVTIVEGYNIEKYVGNTFTLGFRARVPVAGIHCVALRNGGTTDRSYIAEINFPVANAIQNCSITVIGGLPIGGTWNYTNGAGLSIWFTHGCGPTFQTTPNAWQVGSFLATANQVNDAATANNLWAMEKVTLNLGTVAAVSEISFEQELIRCMRYYEPIVPVSARVTSSAAGGGFIETPGIFKVSKRAIPTLTPGGAVASSNVVTETAANATTEGFRYSVSIGSGASTDTYVIGRTYAVSARL